MSNKAFGDLCIHKYAFLLLPPYATERKNRSENIVENMFHKLERYSLNLEEMVKERTTLLEIERERVDTLLSRILPP